MNRRLFKGLLGAATLALIVSSCQSNNNATTAGGKALIAEPTTGVTFSEDFNPYDSNSVASSMGTRSMVNEPLIEFNQLDATAAGTHPWLATAFAFQNSGKDLQVTIRQGVKFSDGSAFGPADVAATFKMLENPKANTRGVPSQASDPTVNGNTVTLHFASAQYTGLFNILSNTFMMQASVANQIAANPTMTIKVPVGTGPFMLGSYSSSLIKWKPNPNYWGGTPPESEIDTPSIATNAAASDALVSGQLDWAGNDIPNVYANYVNLNPLTNHAWFAAGSTVTLWFNLNPGNGGATGIGDVAVRKAVSYGVDRNALALLGESGYEQPASSSSGLILPNQSAFLPSDGSLKNDLSISGSVPDAATAKADNLPAGADVYDILKAGGWNAPATSRYDSSTGTFKSGGNCDGTNTANCWTKGGQIIKFSVYDPVPFSDYWENAALMSQELQPLGMDVTTKPAQGYSDWNTNITSQPSQWQTAIHWGNGGSIPYIQYQNWLDSTDANSVAHYQGWSDPAADAALRQYESTDPSDTASLYPVVQKLENIMSSEVPDAPLLYGADWNVFSSAKYTGWPNQSHPYMNPSPSYPLLPYILMLLKTVSITFLTVCVAAGNVPAAVHPTRRSFMTVVPTGVRSDESGLVARLTLEQKVHLLTGADSWALHGESAVGLRPLLTSDGPAGVRGRRFDPSNPSTSLPCPVAIAATWDLDLVEEMATALGREARSKGVDVLLAPTMNIIRTPLSGRGFECFSEDPLLTSRVAVAYVRGVQRAGVGATAKHYVANDSETERRSYVARISEGVLREMYLPPFEACVGEAGVFLVMAAYNAVNGPTMTANAILLHDVLKTDWGFTGVVISDWSATTTTVPSALAGLDLVMPGPDGPWGDKLVDAVRNGAVPEAAIDDKVSRIFSLARRLGGFNGSLAAPVPELVDPGLLTRVTSRSFVLLSNPRGLLPLKKANLRSVALIGPNAIEPQTQGGGSVRVLPSVRVKLAESLRRALGDATPLSVHQGCLTGATVPLPMDGTLRDLVSGKAGARLEIRDPAGEVVYDALIPSSIATWWDGLPEAVHRPGSAVVMRAVFRPEIDGPYVLGAAGAGHMRVTVNGTVLAEATSLFPGEVVEALGRPPELRVPISLEAGRDVDMRLDYRPERRFVTLRLGLAPQQDDEDLIEEAARAADDSDVAVVVVGSAEGTESEGYDKETMVLPGRQDELVRRVAAANPNTVVVVNTGMPVLMPWADQVAAVMQVWFPGQAFGEALAETLLGIAEPTGRLPVTVPRAEADSPVLRARPDAGDLVYREGLLVGYRGYDRIGTEPQFAFGHGLGYTEWTYESLVAGAESINAGEDMTCTVTVRNSGKRRGREVVQVYLEAQDDDPSRPLRVLAGFATVDVEAGAQAEVMLTLPARSFARFDEATRKWAWHAGTYTLRAGRSSRDLKLDTKVVLR